MRGLTLCLAATLTVLGTNAIDVGIEMFKEILNFPLRTNPFFAKIISLGDDFNAEGIIDGEIDSSGYVCQTLGNIKCEDEHQPLCSGLGVIDCTDECAGTEDEFKKFQEVMEDPDFAEKYPELDKIRKAGGKKKKAVVVAAEESSAEPEPEPESTPKTKDDVRTKFFKEVGKCTGFSDAIKAMINLASGTGGGFGGDTDDPNSITYVDPSALSDIATVEYDYSDYYEDEEEIKGEEETRKKRRNAEKDYREQETNDEIRPQKSKLRYEKEKYYKSVNNAKSEDVTKEATEDQKINMNMIRSVDEEMEDMEMAGKNTNESADPSVSSDVSAVRMRREVRALRRLFHIQTRTKREVERNKSLAEEEVEVVENPCVIRNMTCVKYPSKTHCKGIAVGRCGSRTDLLAKLFTPHVVMVTVVSLLVIIAVTVGLSYYCYRLKAENRVEPNEVGPAGAGGEQKNGDVKHGTNGTDSVSPDPSA